MTSFSPRICVVGASNLDLVSFAPRLPKWGETLRGTRFHIGFGGKGANQAVMAAKLGAQVSLVAKIGQDMLGENALKNFQQWHIDTSHILTTDQAYSGVAPIVVDPDGRNAIIVVTGANDLLTPAEVEAARPAIAASQILVCQLEIPVETSLAAMRIARQEGVITIFNPAPARADVPDEFFALSDYVAPNESETELITGMAVDTIEHGVAAARWLLDKGAGRVILTLGERGSLLVTPIDHVHVPAVPVKAVDSTGAGDAFIGSLAYFLAAGLDVAEAMRRANRIAAISVQATGAQTSFPAAAGLPPDLLALNEPG